MLQILVITISSVNLVDNGSQYRVIISAPGLPSVTSNVATLRVYNVTITSSPLSTTVLVNARVLFSVTATTTIGTLTYQWQRASNGSNTFNNIVGATNASYTIASASATENGSKYRVIVTSGLASANSNVATLNITNLVITNQPSDIVISGLGVTNATFRVVATTDTGIPLTYQWQIAPSGSTIFTNIAGAISASYTIASVGLSDIGKQYRVLVTSGITITSNVS